MKNDTTSATGAEAPKKVKLTTDERLAKAVADAKAKVAQAEEKAKLAEERKAKIKEDAEKKAADSAKEKALAKWGGDEDMILPYKATELSDEERQLRTNIEKAIVMARDGIRDNAMAIARGLVEIKEKKLYRDFDGDSHATAFQLYCEQTFDVNYSTVKRWLKQYKTNEVIVGWLEEEAKKPALPGVVNVAHFTIDEMPLESQRRILSRHTEDENIPAVWNECKRLQKERNLAHIKEPLVIEAAKNLDVLSTEHQQVNDISKAKREMLLAPDMWKNVFITYWKGIQFLIDVLPHGQGYQVSVNGDKRDTVYDTKLKAQQAASDIAARMETSADDIEDTTGAVLGEGDDDFDELSDGGEVNELGESEGDDASDPDGLF